MQAKANRLFFIDAMRAWAILMMLQGHFIDGLLDPIFRDSTNMAYKTWLYFRGITAPVFFTVSGFIFTYLLLRAPENGLANPRVKKGIKRGLQLLLIGYALRLNLFGLFKGQLYGGFFLVDVLHCIGLSILAIVGLYVLTAQRKRFWFPTLLLATTLLLFLFEPLYKQWSFNFLPAGLANYFTRANGSVFTIIPWLGYTTLGAAISLLFYRFRNFKYLYPVAIVSSLLLGYGLITQSSAFFLYLGRTWDLSLFTLIQTNNYLFIRLGDVLVVFAVFMLLRRFLNQRTILRIGANTLSIYSGLDAPVRCGIFAASAANKTRRETGATYWGIMEMSGNCYEPVISVGNSQTRDFSGDHGDGNLPSSGNASVSLLSDWVFGSATGLGLRSSEISTRYLGNYNDPDRAKWIEIRGVRTAQ